MTSKPPWARGHQQAHQSCCPEGGDFAYYGDVRGNEHYAYCYACREFTDFIVKPCWLGFFGPERCYVLGRHNAQDDWDQAVAAEAARKATA